MKYMLWYVPDSWLNISEKAGNGCIAPMEQSPASLKYIYVCHQQYIMNNMKLTKKEKWNMNNYQEKTRKKIVEEIENSKVEWTETPSEYDF